MATSMLDDIVNAEAPAFQQRQTNRALSGGSRDGLAVWDDGSLFINAPAPTGEAEPSETDKALVKKAMNGDAAARSELELKAALGDNDALHSLQVMDAYGDTALAPVGALHENNMTRGSDGATIGAPGSGSGGMRASSSGGIGDRTIQAAINGDANAIKQIQLAAAKGDPAAIQALNVIGKSGGGSSTTPSKPKSGGGGGGGSSKKPYTNTQGNPSSIPHDDGSGADYESGLDTSHGFDDLPPVKSSVKPPPQPKGAGDKVHAYGNKNAKTGDVDIVNGKFVWKGSDGDNSPSPFFNPDGSLSAGGKNAVGANSPKM